MENPNSLFETELLMCGKFFTIIRITTKDRKLTKREKKNKDNQANKVNQTSQTAQAHQNLKKL